MRKPNRKPKVKLVGEDGNAFFIIGRVREALQKAGADKECIDKFVNEAMSGDYNNVLTTAMEYVEVY